MLWEKQIKSAFSSPPCLKFKLDIKMILEFSSYEYDLRDPFMSNFWQGNDYMYDYCDNMWGQHYNRRCRMRKCPDCLKTMQNFCHVDVNSPLLLHFISLQSCDKKNIFPKLGHIGVKYRSLTDKTQIGSDWCHWELSRCPWQDSWNLIRAFNAP